MSRFASTEDLAAKIEWEGGITEAILDYGIKSEDLPEGTPDEVVKAWQLIETDTAQAVKVISDWLPELDEEGM